MKLAIAYSTKDQVELTKQTLPHVIQKHPVDVFWCDGSSTEEGKALPEKYGMQATRVVGGADAAIAWKLSTLLNHPENYTHIGLLENDVLLDPDWLAPTFELFEKGKADGLHVGAVSPRSYVDRILVQRDGYACMHNLGAGCIIFTREAAAIALQTFRTHWWLDNVRLFAQLSGIDLRTYACFRGNEQFITTDWGWEAQLARHGLASLALTPARCEMIGQVPPLAQQGLELVTKPVPGDLPILRDQFEIYRTNLANLRRTHRFETPGIIHRQNGGALFFPHQLGNLVGTAWRGNLELRWNQGFGPFAYRAGPGGASLVVRASGSCAFQCSGGDAGARIVIEDTRSGFKVSPMLPAGIEPIAIQVPGGPIPRLITMQMDEGAVFNGLSTADPQMLDTYFRFDWSQLPEAK